jgi:maltose-binding protein MalE
LGYDDLFSGKRIIVDGKVVIDPAAWELMTDLWLKGGMSIESLEYMWVDAPEVFAKGKAGFILTGGVYMKMFADPEFAGPIQGDWAVTINPAWEGVDIPGRAVAGNDAWMINPYIDPKKIAAAILWLDFQRSFVAAFNELYVEGNEAVVKAVYDHPAIIEEVENPELRKATVAAQAAELYPPGMMEVLDIFKEYLHEVALGELDPTEARIKAQEEIDKIV